MSMTKDLHEVLLLAKKDSLLKVRNDKFFEQSTIEFFNGIFEVLNNMMNDVIDTEYLEEEEFTMKNMHSLTSIKQRIEECNKMKSEDKS